ncbi:nickel ABC transporter, nickel/metallophore periplasmic binding protein, partial [Klebsiella pneumoniae]|nr:nickel ABC transporter, nickel/metallophore periplasmic binding protein [Klebsiella pneumoniae]
PWRHKAVQSLARQLACTGPDALATSMGAIIRDKLRQVGVRVTLVGEEESGIYARQREVRFGVILNGTWVAPYGPRAFVIS